ncbi:hypothetical protein AVEN_787-1 [Araneus ventricosus]|uniref:Uncharacterized protein n=1 Tax=Araneus ventricosus TaxID=182803 RepID=A0A4Y2H697_ARAVE|nr:hypothetical protein AVEN_787-1 [Araneus ventricosus]
MMRTTPDWQATPAGELLTTTYDFTPCTADLQWYRVFGQEPSDLDAETLPLGHPHTLTTIHISESFPITLHTIVDNAFLNE